VNGRAVSLLGSILAAVVSSACCWLPLALMGVGLSAAGAAAVFERFRVVFLLAAAALLTVGFYLSYFRKERCAPGEACARPNARLRRFNRGMLWFSTAVVFAFALFPNYVGVLAGAQQSATGTASVSTKTWTLRIDGMTCGGCETAVATALLRVPGVLSATASYIDGTATITVDQASPPSQTALSTAVTNGGYSLVAPDSASTSGVSPSGHWLAKAVDEGDREFEIILDIGQSGSRWVGEFDLPQYGVENYPVEVTVIDSLIALHFSAMNVDFKGALSDGGSTLSGRAGEDEDWKLSFTRGGKATFSEQFMKLEAAADDSAAVRILSNDAAELRTAFNKDTDKVRLLLLLAPS
jgi:copper chaperone CopZ